MPKKADPKPDAATEQKPKRSRKTTTPKEAKPKEPPQPVTFHERVARAFASLDNVPKTGWNSFHQYMYTTEVDLIRAIRPVMAANGLFLIANDRSVTEVEPGHVRLEVEYTLMDVTGESLSFTGYGEGRDVSKSGIGDKALYKAKTGALKYALSKTFMIDTGDDPELPDEKRNGEPVRGSDSASSRPPATRAQPSRQKPPATGSRAQASAQAPASQPEADETDDSELPANILKRTATWCRRLAGELEEHGYTTDEAWQESHHILATLIGAKYMDSLHDLNRKQADRIDAVLKTKNPQQIRNLVNTYVAEANAPQDDGPEPT